MSHETSQITGLHHVFPAQPTVGTWTEIGRAEVVHTMFGKAKVRIVREQGKNQRTGRLLMALAATALGAAAWQGWVASTQTETAQTADISLPAVASVQQTVPVLPTDAARPAMPPSAQSQPARPAETERPPVSQRVAPQPPVVTVEEQPAAKPATVHRLKADAPQEAVVAGGSASADQAGIPASAKPLPAKQPAVAAIATAHVTKADVQPAAAGPAAKVPAPTPAVNEPARVPSPAVDMQPAAPLSGQGQ